MSACVQHITCDNKDLSWEQLAKLLGTVTGAGCPALRTIEGSEQTPPTNFRLRPDGSRRLRPDGSFMLRP